MSLPSPSRENASTADLAAARNVPETLLSSAELASYKLPSSPPPSSPFAYASMLPSVPIVSSQSQSQSQESSESSRQGPSEVFLASSSIPSPPLQSKTTLQPKSPQGTSHSSSQMQSQSHNHHLQYVRFPDQQPTDGHDNPAIGRLEQQKQQLPTQPTLQDQQPITTVAVQSQSTSAPTSPLVHTLHAKPFTPSKPPNLAAAPFVPTSFLMTTPTASSSASVLPRYPPPVASTSPVLPKSMITTSTQYPSPDPSPRNQSAGANLLGGGRGPSSASKPTAPTTPTPIRVGHTPGDTPPLSPTLAHVRSNPPPHPGPWLTGQPHPLGYGQGGPGGEKRDIFGQLAHQLSSLEIDRGDGVDVGRRGGMDQPVLAMAAEVGPPTLPAHASMPTPPSLFHHSAMDRPIKGEPDACLFVASLNAQKTDEQLTESVTKHFEKWGELMGVKVMKDWMNRPYAFVQYKSVPDAQRALDESHDTVVDGRHVRVEAARVNRTMFLSKLPKTMTDDVLHQFMSKWGKVEDVTLILNQLTGRPKGCAFAKFRYREDAIRAYLHIRQQGKWGVEWAANLEKTKPETDRLSIFVGQLNPDEVTEQAVRARFAQYGTIENVHLIVADGEAFAFIKYDDETGSQLAINNENGKELQGSRMCVQFRETPEHKSPMVRRPLGREPKPLTRPASNKPVTTSSSTGHTTRGSSRYYRTVSFDGAHDQELLNGLALHDPHQQQQQQQQQQGSGSQPRSPHSATSYSNTITAAGTGPSYHHQHHHHHHSPPAHQHGYPPYYPQPHMFAGYYGHPGYYPPPPHLAHQHGAYYPPPPVHPHTFHGYPPNMPYGVPHVQPGGSGAVGQLTLPPGYSGTQRDAYHAAPTTHQQQQAGNAMGGIGGTMFDPFYDGVGYPADPSTSTGANFARQFATSSPTPRHVPTVPYPTQPQQSPHQHPAPPAATDVPSKAIAPFASSASSAPKSLFSTLTASAAAGRAEQLESMYTQSLKSALAGLSSADAARTPLASVVSLGSPVPPALTPGSSGANVTSSTEGSVGAVAGMSGAGSAGATESAVLPSGFESAFGSALFPPLGAGVGMDRGVSRTGGKASGTASTRRGSPEALVSGIIKGADGK